MDMDDETPYVPLRLNAHFRVGAGPEERLTFPVHANLGHVVSFERSALSSGKALCTPLDSAWKALRHACDLVDAYAWRSEYHPSDDAATDLGEWSIEIEWTDRTVQARGRGAFPPLSDTAPPQAALRPVIRALSRIADGRELFTITALPTTGRFTRVDEAGVRTAVELAARRLRDDDRMLEVRLDSSLSAGLHRATTVEAHRGSAPLSGWSNPNSEKREIDVFAEGVAFEQKVDDLDQQLWDALKLASMLRDGDVVQHAYLVAWATRERFETGALSELYRGAGTWSVADLVRRYEARWRTDVSNGSNAPLLTPARFGTRRVACVDCGDGREIRAIKLVLEGNDTLEWLDGMPVQSPEGVEEPLTLRLDAIVDAWIETLTPDATWWHRARYEAYAAVTGLDLACGPSTLPGAVPAWFDSDAWAGHFHGPPFTGDRARPLTAVLQAAASNVAHDRSPFHVGLLEVPVEVAAFEQYFDDRLTRARKATHAVNRQIVDELVEALFKPPSDYQTTARALRSEGFDPDDDEPDPEF